MTQVTTTSIHVVVGVPAHDKATLIHEPINIPLDVLNLSLELLVLVGGDTGSDDRPRDATSTTEGGLRCDEDVLDVLSSGVRQAVYDIKLRFATYLLLAQQGEMEKDFQRLRIGSQNDQFSDTTVEGLGS